ncbi:MAG: type II toxin-antitoxin system antitoxin SocA domain-containing protein [Candidatus Portnoybacteria bacterium]
MANQKNNKNKKEITYKDIADYLLALANETGEPITNLKLQKLVYYAQAWYLANYSKPLFKKDFEAWVHGPVIPELYQFYKERGSSPIETDLKLDKVEERFDKKTLEFLEEFVSVYMPFTAYQLEQMVHSEDPWLKIREGYQPDEICNNTIPKELIKKFYGEKIKNKTN